MLISHNKKFIFIHLYKVAGRSISEALKNYSDGGKKYYAHIKAKELKKELPEEIYDNFFKFVFVRNPWDWQVSLYFFMLGKKDHFQHEIIKKMSGFDEYIYWRVNKDKKLQQSYLMDDENNIIVDFIGKYENLQNDFKTVCKRLEINDAVLPHVNKTVHNDYKSYYNSKTIKLVEDHFKEDIELFGYTFEGLKR